MTTISNKFVVRLLDAEDQLLAWATIYPELRPHVGRASCGFVATEPTPLPIDRDGVATRLAVHWCDLDLARITSLVEPMQVTAGQLAHYGWIEPVWLVSGMRDVPLPATTERNGVTVGVPTGTILAATTS